MLADNCISYLLASVVDHVHEGMEIMSETSGGKIVVNLNK